MRYVYEWERPINKTIVFNRIDELKKEIQRISNVALRGNFKIPDDRIFLVEKLKKLNGELIALERQYLPGATR